MKSYLEERLENVIELKKYYEDLIRMRAINDKIKEEYYNDKPYLYFFLYIYFLPLNIFRYFTRLKDLHEYGMINKEIEVIKRAIKITS